MVTVARESRKNYTQSMGLDKPGVSKRIINKTLLEAAKRNIEKRDFGVAAGILSVLPVKTAVDAIESLPHAKKEKIEANLKPEAKPAITDEILRRVDARIAKEQKDAGYNQLAMEEFWKQHKN